MANSNKPGKTRRIIAAVLVFIVVFTIFTFIAEAVNNSIDIRVIAAIFFSKIVLSLTAALLVMRKLGR